MGHGTEEAQGDDTVQIRLQARFCQFRGIAGPEGEVVIEPHGVPGRCPVPGPGIFDLHARVAVVIVDLGLLRRLCVPVQVQVGIFIVPAVDLVEEIPRLQSQLLPVHRLHQAVDPLTGVVHKELHIPQVRRGLRDIRAGSCLLPQGVGGLLPHPGGIGVERIEDPVVIAAQARPADPGLAAGRIQERYPVGLLGQGGGHISPHMEGAAERTLSRPRSGGCTRYYFCTL